MKLRNVFFLQITKSPNDEIYEWREISEHERKERYDANVRLRKNISGQKLTVFVSNGHVSREKKSIVINSKRYPEKNVDNEEFGKKQGKMRVEWSLGSDAISRSK